MSTQLNSQNTTTNCSQIYIKTGRTNLRVWWVQVLMLGAYICSYTLSHTVMALRKDY